MSDEPTEGAAYVQVALNRPLDRLYTYEVPEELRPVVEPGSRVEVPLAGGVTRGVVVEYATSAPEGVKMKAVRAVLDPLPLVRGDLIALGRWISRYYVCAIGEVLDAMAPGGVQDLQPVPRYRLKADVVTVLQHLPSRAPAQRRLVELIGAAPAGLSRPEINAKEKGAAKLLASLIQQKLVEVRLEAQTGLPRTKAVQPQGFPVLSPEQEACFRKILPDLVEKKAGAHLLHGVTGSGKTEIYLALIRECLAGGRSAIFLLPEISLTVPVMDLLRARFGDLVALLHSAMSPRERYREWVAIARGQRRVVVGARSAVFAPVEKLGLVVIDEEPESSYRQEDRPAYHAREVALERARHHGTQVILGSATPSLETYFEARLGRVGYHRLKERYNRRPMPEVTLIDMGQEFEKHRNKSIFSRELKSELFRVLESKGQALLFLNRRGHSTYIFCRACGHVLQCTSCTLAMNYHLDRGEALCHLCGSTTTPPRKCPSCESPAIRYLGGGTQKVEEEFRVNFPHVACTRMDSDTTRQRGSHEIFLKEFQEGRTQVLIGTQMVGKGFNFPNLELVGVVNADVTLHLSDFRGGERTFMLVTQVAGRVGRGEKPGRVLVQTYSPDHYALQACLQHDYEKLAKIEIERRRQLSYPPYSRLIEILAEGEGELEVPRWLEELKQVLISRVWCPHPLTVMGPVPDRVSKAQGKFRWRVMIKCPSEVDQLWELKDHLRALKIPTTMSVRILVDA